MPRISKTSEKDRYIDFLKHLDNNGGNKADACRKAGFADTTCQKRTKSIYNSAIKRLRNYLNALAEQERELKKTLKKNPHNKDKNPYKEEKEEIKDKKDQLKELVGLDSDIYKSEIVKLATQDKDMSTKLRTLQALSKYTEVDLETRTDKVQTLPTLNITVKELHTTGGTQAGQLVKAEKIELDSYTTEGGGDSTIDQNS